MSRFTIENEHKLLVDDEQLSAILDAADGRISEVVYQRERPIAYTRTTYFDTDELTLLEDTPGQPRRRARVREYAAAASLHDAPRLSGACYVELKERVGARRSKTRARVATGWAARMVSGECGLPAWLPHHDRLGAVTTVIYQRRSFRDLSTGMRITLDSGVTITAPAVPGEPLAGSGEKADLPHVLEAKGSGPLPEWLRAACAALGVTPVGFSKYQLAMERRRRALTNTTASKSNANPAPGAPPELEQAIG